LHSLRPRLFAFPFGTAFDVAVSHLALTSFSGACTPLPTGDKHRSRISGRRPTSSSPESRQRVESNLKISRLRLRHVRNLASELASVLWVLLVRPVRQILPRLPFMVLRRAFSITETYRLSEHRATPQSNPWRAVAVAVVPLCRFAKLARPRSDGGAFLCHSPGALRCRPSPRSLRRSSARKRRAA
jgi:hypothetical protein